MEITITLNGARKTFSTFPDEHVADLLKRQNLMSIRQNCDREGACGGCSIILNGRKVCSCLLLTSQVDGGEILTVEGLSKGRELHAIQQAFLKAGIAQCGQCTPGMILSVYELLSHHDNPAREEIQDALSGNFCRCTGYEQFFDAIRSIRGESDAAPSPTFRDDLRVVGKPLPKVDARRPPRGDPQKRPPGAL